MRIYRLVILSRWATARQRSTFWREILSSSRRPRSLSDSGKWCSNQNSNCVNFLGKYEYYENKCQPTQSNVNAEVSRVFGRSHGRQRNQARASITMQDLQVPRTLNEWQIWGKSVLQIATKENTPFLCDWIILAGLTINVVPRQGKRMALSEHGHILNACQLFKAMNEAQVESIVMEAFGKTIPRLVDIEILMSVHNMQCDFI